MLITGNVSPRTHSRTDPVVSHSRLKSAPRPRQVGHTKAVPFRPPPRHAFFSIEESLPRGEPQVVKARPSSQQGADPMQEYFPRASTDRPRTPQFDEPTSSRAQSRCDSVPLPEAENSLEPNYADTVRSVTAPPNVDLSLRLSNLANLSMKAEEVATVAVEKEQQKFMAERRLTISSAMGVRQHGSQRAGSLSGTPQRRKRLGREHSYLCMKFRERPCLRTESFLNDDLYDKVSNLSRECCDVLGPKACHECDRLNRRSNSALRNEANFPSIHISAANFSTMTLVQRARPELNPRQVLERLAHGDISRQSLRHKNSTGQSPESEIDDQFGSKKASVSAFRVSDEQGYFTNFTDLRAQIFARKQGQKQGRAKLFNQGVQSMSNLPDIINVEVVPKQEWERENPANYFGPPMLSRAELLRQRSQPRFYAGAQGKYELPEVPSIDEIARKATGSRHQRLAQLEAARSDTPDSDVSLWSLKSSRKDDEKSGAPGESETVESPNNGIASEAGPLQTGVNLDNKLDLETASS